MEKLKKTKAECMERMKGIKKLQERIDKQIDKQKKSGKEFEEWLAIRNTFKRMF